MIALLLLTSALAADPPEGYKVTKEDVEGCTLMLGPANSRGDIPMRAHCTWTDVSMEQVKATMANWELHDDVWDSVVSSDILSVAGGITQVHQIHQSKGISDREIVLDGSTTETGDGVRYGWTKSSHQLTPKAGNVEPDFDDGYWEFHPAEGGGVTVEYELFYDPGGSVPGFLVRWFQTSGLMAIVTDAHTYLASH